MLLSPDVARERLRELDDPVAIERPPDLDEQALEARFVAPVSALSRAFCCEREVDAGIVQVQDAAFYGTVCVPVEATRSGGQLVVRVSNFGLLAVYDLELFGAYDTEEREQLLDHVDVELLETCLADTGHESVPIDLLWSRYDGASTCFSSDPAPTWFARFFDWV